jgi:very-short-patch-repair endonuclease
VSFENKLIIEVDGGQHNHDDNIMNDETRSMWLVNEGFRVIRFWNNEIRSNLDGVVYRIQEELRESSSSPSFSSPIEGEEG